MKQKIIDIRLNIIRKITQIYADVLLIKIENSLDLEDNAAFDMQIEMAAKLNAYCIVFHDIYLD